MKIKAAVATEPGEPFSVEEVEMTEELGPHEVLVKNVATGLCRSDISMRDLPHGFAPVGFEFLPKPVILGHEGAGIVQRIGSKVTALAPGDHVILTYHYDGTCPRCEQQLEPYCKDFLPLNLNGYRTDGSLGFSSEKHGKIHSGHHQQSSFATYSIATDNNAVKVPKDVPIEMLGPIGCGFLTGAGAVLNRLKPTPGSTLAVFGAGPVGFAGLYMAKKLGSTTRIVIDLVDSRLELAKEFGATHIINPSKVDDTVAAIMEICPDGINFVFEATGVTPVMNQAVASLSSLGTCIFSGMDTNLESCVEASSMYMLLGKTIGGVTMGHSDPHGTIGKLVEAVQSGEFPIEKLITYYDFEDINKAVEDFEKGIVIKPVLKMPTN